MNDTFNTDNEKIGNFIKKLRKEKGLTQKELGEKLNITDKAISKWERGISLPDVGMLNSLSKFFEVTISEILNGKKGIKEEINIESTINDAIEKYKEFEQKKAKKLKKTKRKIKNTIGIFSIIIFFLTLFLQIIYFTKFKRNNFEYVIDSILYVINEVIIISGTLSICCLIKKLKKFKVIICVLCLIFTLINLAFMFNNGFNNECLVSFSKNFSNELVLKINKNTGAIKFYNNSKFYIFAKEKEQFSYEYGGAIKEQWLANDICGITYTDKNGNLREYVATYGDRGSNRSYYYVTSALIGHWQVFNQYGNSTRVLVDSKGITITKNNKKELFEYSNCKQFGTIALVLYNNNIPRYVIALDENCKIDDKTYIIKEGGTITLAEISIEKTIAESLDCIVYKNDNDLENYNVVSAGKNDYKLQNGILYISYDGIKTIEVPGDFSEMIGDYQPSTYQISSEKTIFYYNKNSKRYLVYSDDMGKNWNTVEIEAKSSIQNIQFINSNIGFMLKFKDVAMQSAWGVISKTTDGGKTWEDISNGIGNNEFEKNFKTSSQIKFINENVGFLTIPNVSGISCELYVTRNGGKDFKKIEILESNIYDYYNLPYIQDEKLYIKIGQGNDGDYNGGDYKEYCSEDEGITWYNINN